MSYICLIGNENGIVAGSDSRETIVPNIFFDHKQKIFVDKKQNLIWACCGITKYNGIDYIDVVGNILREENLTFEEKIIKLQAVFERVTKECYNYIGNGSVMDILIGKKSKRKMLLKLNIKNGVVSSNTYFTPLAIEGGSGRLIMDKIPLKEYRNLSLEDLQKFMRKRVSSVIEKDKEITSKDSSHINTIGGDIRVLSL